MFVFVYEIDQLCFLVLKKWPYVGLNGSLRGHWSQVLQGYLLYALAGGAGS